MSRMDRDIENWNYFASLNLPSQLALLCVLFWRFIFGFFILSFIFPKGLYNRIESLIIAVGTILFYFALKLSRDYTPIYYHIYINTGIMLVTIIILFMFYKKIFK